MFPSTVRRNFSGGIFWYSSSIPDEIPNFAPPRQYYHLMRGVFTRLLHAEWRVMIDLWNKIAGIDPILNPDDVLSLLWPYCENSSQSTHDFIDLIPTSYLLVRVGREFFSWCLCHPVAWITMSLERNWVDSRSFSSEFVRHN